MTEIKEQLKELRISAGLSKAELADRLSSGYDVQFVNSIEYGRRNAGIKVIQAWARACNGKVVIE